MAFPGSPEYFDALRKDHFRRALLYTQDSFSYELVPDVFVKPMTLRHYAILDLSLSMFVCSFKDVVDRNLALDAREVAFFLWVISQEYSDSSELQKTFIDKILCKDYETTRDAAWQYCEESLSDWRGVSRNSSATTCGVVEPFACTVSYTVHLLASSYGWNEEYIMSMPLIKLGQYFRHIANDIPSESRLTFLNYHRDAGAREYMKRVREAKESNG
jgi:hypothetical protein